MICRNSEYYADPTAGKAIANVMREQEEANGKIRTWTWDRLDMENWADLGIAIVVRAAEEYRRARLTDMEGELILERLRKEAVE